MLWGIDGYIIWLYLQGLWRGKILFETVCNDLKMNVVTSRATTKTNTKIKLTRVGEEYYQNTQLTQQ